MPNASIIQQNAVSFETIKAALDAYIKSQAPGLRWLDFFESGPGTIIEELMAEQDASRGQLYLLCRMGLEIPVLDVYFNNYGLFLRYQDTGIGRREEKKDIFIF